MVDHYFELGYHMISSTHIAAGINNLQDVWETGEGECNVMMETEFDKMYEINSSCIYHHVYCIT